MPEQPRDDAPRIRYERRDADVRWIIGAGVGLALIMAVSMLGLWILLAAAPPEPTPLPEEAERARGTLLHWRELGDLLHERRAVARDRLSRFEWIDPGRSARIPIDDAIRVIVEREEGAR